MSESTSSSGDVGGQDDNQTTSTRTRWAFTNDVLAGVTVLAHIALLGAALTGDVSVPARIWDVFALEIVLATTWAFGRETLMAVREFWKGSGDGGSM
jgi:hypothetical protein